MTDKPENINDTKIDYSLGTINKKMNVRYRAALIVSFALSAFGIWGLITTLNTGLSPWGITNNVSWGIAISNFIFWIGIAHSGTFISAILFLLNQKWRAEFNRIAELMTIISIVIAASFPLLHTGRPWFASYWLLPYYNNMSLQPNFNSPLTWDIMAILTYFIISIIFFYVGLLPDLNILKSRVSNHLLKNSYHRFSFFWQADKNQWRNYWTLYLILAGIATPLVISVHSIVSFDFAVTFIKSWHSTILPPYFVLGAIFSGLAMVNVIYIIYRFLTKSIDTINKINLEMLNKSLIFLSLSISFIYFTELLTLTVDNLWINPIYTMFRSGYLIMIMLTTNSLLPLLLIFKKVRMNISYTFLISLLVLIGMWLERFILVVNGLDLSTLIVNNSSYTPSLVDYSLLVGSIGIFVFMILIIGKIIPMITIFEKDFNHES